MKESTFVVTNPPMASSQKSIPTDQSETESLPAKTICSSCRQPRAHVVCGLCEEPLCRSCVLRLNEAEISLLTTVPPVLSKEAYCHRCYDTVVESALTEVQALLERARNIHYWPKAYRGSVPVLKRGQREVEVSNCKDHAEAVLRLAVQTAELGFNGMIRCDIKSRKSITNGYGKMMWHGRALPAKVDEARINREEEREKIYSERFL